MFSNGHSNNNLIFIAALAVDFHIYSLLSNKWMRLYSVFVIDVKLLYNTLDLNLMCEITLDLNS